MGDNGAGRAYTRKTARLAAAASVLSIAALGLSSPSWASEPAATPQQSVVPESAAPASPTNDDWAEPDESVTAKPKEVVADVALNEAVEVVSVVEVDGTAEVVTESVVGKKAAKQEVKAAQQDPATVAVGVGQTYSALGTQDTYWSSLWGLPVLGAQDAWQISTGQSIKVAVLDTGVSSSHPDLSGKVLSGYNSVGASTGAKVDENGHGTHVAGTIAAVQNNNLGITGIAPLAKIIPVKVLNSSGYGTTQSVASGVTWAVDNGADVINMSLGSSSSDSVIQSAVDYARSAGVTVVAAAGNNGANQSSYPAAGEGVISVSALSDADSIASYSNRGDNVDVAAPGSSILSTTPGGGYGYSSGTSMAAPHVAGIAALIIAEDPDVDVEELLQQTAHDLGSTGYDDTFAYGRMDPVAALALVNNGQAPKQAPVTYQKTGQSIKVPGKVKKGKKKKLKKRSNQGVLIKKYQSKSKKQCKTFKRGTNWFVKGKKAGSCKLKVVVPGTQSYDQLKTKVKIRIR